jgi:hypothetical protein
VSVILSAALTSARVAYPFSMATRNLQPLV